MMDKATADQILAKLAKLDQLDDISRKLDTIDCKVTTLDARQLKTEQKVDAVASNVNELQNQVNVLTHENKRMMKAIRAAEIQSIRAEENNRQYNVVINNIPQDDIDEDRKVTLQKVRYVLGDVLKIRGAKTGMVIKNAHRIAASHGIKPIIFKVNTMCDKQLIWDHIDNLKTYNDEQETDRTKIYIDLKNYPAKLNRDKKSLRDKFNELKNAGKKPKWNYNKKTGICYIKAGGKTFNPPSDNFDFKIKESEEISEPYSAWNVQDSEESEYVEE